VNDSLPSLHGSLQALEELEHREPIVLREMVAVRVTGIEHARVQFGP
jgi:hypothetical protein